MNQAPRSPKIMVADDDPTIRMLVSEVLSSEGMQVHALADGVSALADFAVFAPDLALLDVHMPGLDGYQVCERLRARGLPEEFPIILVTAQDDEPGVARAFAAGATYFFMKPLSWTLLPHRIQYFLRAADAARRLRESMQQAAVLFETAAEGILLVDAQTGQIQDANPEMCRMLGYGRETLLTLEWGEIYPAARGQAGRVGLHPFALSGSGRSEGLLMRQRDGHLFHADVTYNRMMVNGRLCVAGFFVDATEKRLAEQALLHRATHDQLTGLPNRALLMERLTQAIKQAHRTGSGVIILFLDLDRFKPVNDRHGHAVGDEILKAVARCLRQQIREGDTVARLGGDEFVILMPMVTGDPDDAASATVRRVLNALSTPFAVPSGEVVIGASIGIARYPKDSQTPSGLLHWADQAMYREKRSPLGDARDE